MWPGSVDHRALEVELEACETSGVTQKLLMKANRLSAHRPLPDEDLVLLLDVEMEAGRLRRAGGFDDDLSKSVQQCRRSRRVCQP